MRLEYDREGHLIRQTPAPRAVGTTVAVRDLFKALPVRHKVWTDRGVDQGSESKGMEPGVFLGNGSPQGYEGYMKGYERV